jgi:hypothetical protein
MLSSPLLGAPSFIPASQMFDYLTHEERGVCVREKRASKERDWKYLLQIYFQARLAWG